MADLFPSITPMVFGYNNPILFNDPLGLFGDDIKKNYDVDGGNLGSVTVTATRLNEDGTQDFTWLYNYIGKSNSPISRFVRSKGEDAYRFWHTNRTMHWGKQPKKSKWMEDFNKVFGTALNVGVTGTIVSAFAAPIIAEAVVEAGPLLKFQIEQNIKSGITNMMAEFITQGLSNGPNQGIGDIDFFDVVMAGLYGYNSFISNGFGAMVNLSGNNQSLIFANPEKGIADLSAGLLSAGLTSAYSGKATGTGGNPVMVSMLIDLGVKYLNMIANKNIELHKETKQ